MGRLLTMIATLLVAVLYPAVAEADEVDALTRQGAVPEIPAPLLLLTPPPVDGPVVIFPSFDLIDINQINDVDETFEFTGVLTLVWNDPRLAFQPTDGVNELVYQGDYQFNEIATGWFPTVVLANQSGLYDVSGVVLRIQPDGTSTLVQMINAIAEADMDMGQFPFDSHNFEAIFQLVGFNNNEVRFWSDPDSGDAISTSSASLPQWKIAGLSLATTERSQPHAGGGGDLSALVVSVEAERASFYIRRMVSFPLSIIVLLSFSVFWMDRSSLGDRISVSFIGILTAVSYQLVMGSVLPKISYFTLMHAYLILSFVTMCATVVINLWVGALDKKGHYESGDLIDRRCRWLFPLVYFGLAAVMLVGREVFF